MAGLPRTNCWSLAEHAGEACPRGMQRLLSSASWDADRVLRDVRDWVVSRLGEPGGILVIDETGDLKKGAATVGVQRQYTGTAARIESSQVAVYLTYACGQSDKGACVDGSGVVSAEVLDRRCPADGRCRGSGRGRVRDQARAGSGHDQRRAGRGGSRLLGGRRRGLRRRFQAAPASAPSRPRLRLGGREEPSDHHRDRAPSGDRPGGPAAETFVAAAFGRAWLQG